MAKLVSGPKTIPAAGNMPKLIKEFFGAVNTGSTQASIARMNSPKGWREPGQTPEFDEYTVVEKGELKVETRDHTYFVRAGQAFLAQRGEWVRYSTPVAETAYLSVCIPAFSPETVHRDAE
ncbi:MAG: cupin [Nitrospinaceae bacterium]|jgi:quercetin dioxygenase-like cupin family protein|nr:MAG: cupin [Nitrospinaceae bacterium]